jgi:crotonobetaine/carnitine-CoA ligase
MLPWAHLHATGTTSFRPQDLGPDDAFYAPYAMYHVTGKAAVCTMAAVAGRVVLRESFKTGEFWGDVDRYRCTTTVLMGVMAQFLHAQPGPERVDTPLRNIMMAPMIGEVEAFKARFGVRVRSCFNMTEVSVPIVTDGWDLPNEESCGRLRPGCHARIVDEHDQELPDGTVGELLIRADDPWTMNAGYWRNPEATAAAWRNLWLHTGDAARRDADGNYYYVDRLKDSIRRRGENISSLELEREVLECAGVVEVAAVAVAADDLEDEIKVVVVVEAGHALTPAELCAFLAARVPRYMVPRYVEIVAELPKTPTQKIRKSVLRDAGITPQTWDRTRHDAPAPVAGG